MKIIQINHFPNKAAGSIMMNIHNRLLTNGYDSYVAWGRGRDAENNHEIKIGNACEVYYHALYSRLTDKTGFASKRATNELIRKLKIINPDIIHLHCIHGYYINIKILFDYIKRNNKRVIWTFHDCWPITGHCAYFDMCECEKWKTGCSKCSQLDTYPSSYIRDSSEKNWRIKKDLFTDINMSIITPSYWLKKILEQSFLKNFPVKVINNGIDLNIFSRASSEEIKSFKLKNKLNSKFIILGVASEWSERKGLYDFILLDKQLKKMNLNDYKIILVGLNKRQIKALPDSFMKYSRTNNVKELALLYSISNVFFNPTYEDNFPTTNIEALACGTPVITYDTGGSPECIKNKNDGAVVEKGNIEEALKCIISIPNKIININKEKYSIDTMCEKYMEIYNESY